VWDDTILLFTSDNGGNNFVGGNNFPYRGSKSMSWEGGVRVPAFIRAPERFHFEPRDYRGLMHISDFFPTILRMIGHPQQGEAMRLVLHGGMSDSVSACWRLEKGGLVGGREERTMRWSCP
jgi:arylsulfatase A-like enzyme